MVEDEMLNHFFIIAREAKRDYENDTSEENKEYYDVARSAFRKQVIVEMRDQLEGALTAYLSAAEDVKAAYEVINGADKWFSTNGLASGLPSNFLKQIKLPSPYNVSVSNLCGTESKFRVPFADFLTDDALAIWEDRFMYHDDHTREEREAPMDMKNYPKEFNAGLGR